MTVSSEEVQIGIIEEVTLGVTPATPAFDLVRLVSDGLIPEFGNTLSQELGAPSRGVTDSILTGLQTTGPIAFELATAPWLELLLSAVLGSDWGNDPLGITITADQAYTAKKLRTFTLEKRYELTDAPTFNYQRFTGCMVNEMTLSITPNEPITGSFEMLGTAFETDTATIAGATYIAAGTNPIMTAPLVSEISLKDVLGGTEFPWVAASQFTGLTISLTNNASPVNAIGQLGATENNLNRFEASVEAPIYYVALEPFALVSDQTEFSLEIRTDDDAGNFYDFAFPRCKASGVGSPTPGVSQDIITELAIMALTGPVPATHPLIITRA